MVNAGDVRVRRAVEADVERLWEMCRDQTEAEFASGAPTWSMNTRL